MEYVVNHGGDSDSTGAVTGNIVGAYLGYDKIPQKFLTTLELKHIILKISDNLFHDCQMTECEFYCDEVWAQSYISNSYAIGCKA